MRVYAFSTCAANQTSACRASIVTAGFFSFRRNTNGENLASAHVLTDREEIQRWAEQRDGQPACVRGTGRSEDVGMIRIDFPGYSGENSLEEISWDDWFEKFEERGLALLVQDHTARGQQSNFNKLVSRETAGRTSRGGGSSRGRRSAPSSRSSSSPNNSGNRGTARGQQRTNTASGRRSGQKSGTGSRSRRKGTRSATGERRTGRSVSARGRSATTGRSRSSSRTRSSRSTSSRRRSRTTNRGAFVRSISSGRRANARSGPSTSRHRAA